MASTTGRSTRSRSFGTSAAVVAAAVATPAATPGQPATTGSVHATMLQTFSSTGGTPPGWRRSRAAADVPYVARCRASAPHVGRFRWVTIGVGDVADRVGRFDRPPDQVDVLADAEGLVESPGLLQHRPPVGDGRGGDVADSPAGADAGLLRTQIEGRPVLLEAVEHRVRDPPAPDPWRDGTDPGIDEVLDHRFQPAGCGRHVGVDEHHDVGVGGPPAGVPRRGGSGRPLVAYHGGAAGHGLHDGSRVGGAVVDHQRGRHPVRVQLVEERPQIVGVVPDRDHDCHREHRPGLGHRVGQPRVEEPAGEALPGRVHADRRTVGEVVDDPSTGVGEAKEPEG